MRNIVLRDVIDSDLPVFFEYQRDREANYMAAFTSKDPNDWGLFAAHWDKILADKNIIKQTIIVQDNVVGHVLCFEQFGKPEVSYWIGRRYWGQGIATKALQKFLNHVTIRPLYARAAKDNIGSLKVLERCGFTISGEDSGFSNARGEDVEEFVLILLV
ncbi:GNAT family N-acetyltransferase [Paenactinomyces guangxiensis]|uniref:GNAT family N-acetyltransferase n=1 Tax=Paenactinomyces guangxiensis TaxID=1490290 RepID=A0A7W1WNY1_9BACL|nr:GNAT family N-acetyltransferase [Paenactinomyces guangxiensis]MBA4493372.1 GNAT family N-acetyltransferase [Paenactinomyces guangxiensis]MBH8590462.1 GNAT family N-acetyltransferase [Paenactinomyces guangxiensis]